MSFDAIAWALDQPVGRSAAKFLLVALADCVNGEGIEDMLAFPSAAHLARRTAQDEKTVQANLARLREQGFIEDTGERRGNTRQIVVYRLKTPEIGPLFAQESSAKDPQISGVTPPNLAPSSDDETPPNFPVKTPKFPPKDPQISGQRPPNLGDGTSKEPIKEPVRNQKKRAKRDFDPLTVELPDWLPAETWAMWVRNRAEARKPLTVDAVRLQLRKLGTLRDAGHDPVLVIERAVESDWQGLFPAKDGSTLQRQRAPSARAGAPAWQPAGEPPWWEQAGFECRDHAANFRCHAGNYREFRNGERIPEGTPS